LRTSSNQLSDVWDFLRLDEWEPTQFEGISIKVLYEDKPKAR
jgi:hypothetical protein